VSVLLQAWLVAWLFALGVALGSLANLMVISLTGGRWAAPVRGPWRVAARAIPWLALGFLPVALGVTLLYPWTGTPGTWLNTPFFIARGVAYLVAWSVLAWGYLRAEKRAPESAAVRAWSAAGLIVYAITVSLAAVDWIASRDPAWSSSGFGLVIGTGQMLAAAAFGIAWAGFPRRDLDAVARGRFNDLGNLLLMYVLTWAYLAYTQFLIIWSGNLPREVAWYVPRLEGAWTTVAIAIVAFHFALPLVILLSRRAKRAPRVLASLAALVLAAHLVEVCWLVLPSAHA
jgi:hypothetical protein